MTDSRRATDADVLREQVREGYARLARERDASDTNDDERVREQGRRLGYDAADLAAAPAAANLGVGCGNPTAIDALRPGETVVDLGSGAGLDAFLAARQVGPAGHVIGVDMTPDMIERARRNAEQGGYANVEFRPGQIEALPLEDASADVVISNCVINLSPEKDRVFAEAYRVLRPGGRLMISDIVLERPLPDEVVESLDAWIGCVGGASLRAAYLDAIAKAGFRDVRVERETSFAATFPLDDPSVRQIMDRLGLSPEQAREYAGRVTSLSLFARK